MINRVEGESFEASTRASRQNAQITNLRAFCHCEANTNSSDFEFGVVCFYSRKPLAIYSVVELLLVFLDCRDPAFPARKLWYWG